MPAFTLACLVGDLPAAVQALLEHPKTLLATAFDDNQDVSASLFKGEKKGRFACNASACTNTPLQLHRLQQRTRGRGLSSWLRWPLEEMGAQTVVQCLAMVDGNPLQAHQRALVAENGKDRIQEHPPLWKANATTHAAVWQPLEEADQIGCGNRVLKQRHQGVTGGMDEQTRMR